MCPQKAASYGIEADFVRLCISPRSGIILIDGMVSFNVRWHASQSSRIDRDHCACYQPDRAHE